jgi:hypothetical protein
MVNVLNRQLVRLSEDQARFKSRSQARLRSHMGYWWLPGPHIPRFLTIIAKNLTLSARQLTLSAR